MSKTHANSKQYQLRTGTGKNDGYALAGNVSNQGQAAGASNKQSKMQSALSLHLNNLVQRTQKNLNTGVFTQLNPSTSPMLQTGIGFSSSVKNKRADDIFGSIERNGESGLGLFIGAGNNGVNDIQSTSNQNLRRGFLSTPQHNNLIYPSNLTRPATSSGGAPAQGGAIGGQYQKQSVHTLQQMLNNASQMAAAGAGDSGGATAAANYEAARQDLISAAKRSRSTQPGFQQRVNTGVYNYFQGYRSMEGAAETRQNATTSADNKHSDPRFEELVIPSQPDMIEMDQRQRIFEEVIISRIKVVQDFVKQRYGKLHKQMADIKSNVLVSGCSLRED